MIDKSKFIATFTDEANGYLTILNQGLVRLESSPKNIPLLEELFRAAHTLKGAARMMGYESIHSIAHAIEELFGLLKAEKLNFRTSIADSVFLALDTIKKAIENVGLTQKEDIDPAQVICAMQVFCLDKKTDTKDFHAVSPKEEKTDPNPEIKIEAEVETEKPDVFKKETIKKSKRYEEATFKYKPPKKVPDFQEEYIRVPLKRINNLLNLIGEIVINKVKSSHKILLFKKLTRQSFAIEKMLFDLDTLVKETFSIPDELIFSKGRVLRASQEMEKAAHLLNYLHGIESMAQNLRKEIASLSDNMQTEIFHLNPLVEEMQQKMKEMRMLPCATLFEGFPRLVRDIAHQQSKDVGFVIRGAQTELDKKVLEEIKGPLIHILRNAVDHGLETSQERLLAGKPSKGSMTLEAFQEGGSVIIQVEDDGRGIDLDVIKKKALEKELVSESELADMTDKSILNLIFVPGFSTSPIITDVSGRGVGLDVVRTDIERLKGKVDVISEKNSGTKVRIELPLTIAIMRVLMVVSGGVRWAFPLTSLEQSLTIKQDEVTTLSNHMVIRVQNVSVPLVSLVDVLGLESLAPQEPVKGTGNGGNEISDRTWTVVIVNSLGRKVGFIVDRVLGEEEIFVKNLGMYLGKIMGVHGATVLPSGEVVVILDAQDLVSEAKLAHPAAQKSPVLRQKKKKTRVLVVEDSLTTRELEKTILQNHGYEVDVAIDGLDALEKMNHDVFDVLVSDIQMPRMDGFELCKSIKTNERFKNMPVIFVTALSREDEKRKGIEVGAQAYIMKSQFDQGNLLDAIERLC